VKQKYFETVILLAIVATSIKLIVDTYFSSNSISDYIDMFFTIFFGLEALFKMVAFGFVLDENSYLRESWS